MLNNDNDINIKEKNNINVEPTMILTIDIGNNQLEKLNIYDIDNIEQDIYNFCLKNKLDFNILKEIRNQIQILITNNMLQNTQQNSIKNTSNEISKINEINNIDKNLIFQNVINNSDNLTETNFNTNQQNNFEDLNNFEIFDNNKNKKSNLKKYYNKVNNYDFNNIKDTKKLIRHKNHKSKIEEIDKELKLFYNNNKDNNYLSPQPAIFNDYTPSNSSFFVSPSFNSSNNPNIALRNYFSKEEDNYFTENNPFFENNKKINKDVKRNKANKNINKSMSLNGIYLKKNNPGKDLYERNLKYNEEKKEKLKILKKNLESDQDEDNTFSPKINKISKIQKLHRKQKKLEYSNPDIIKNYKKYKDDKIKSLKQKQEKEFEKKYTFKPIINNSSSTSQNFLYPNHKLINIGKKIDNKNNSNLNNSINDNKSNSCQKKTKYVNKIINNKNKKEYNLMGCSKSITRFEKLYNERINQKENQKKLKQKIYNEYSFKPKINEKSTYFKLDKPFKERLKTYTNKTRENLLRIKNIYEKEKENDESFKPKINTKKNKELLKNKKEVYNNQKINKVDTTIYFINHDNKNKKRKINNKSFSNNNIINITNNYKNGRKKFDFYTKLYLYNEKYKQDKNILTEKFYKSQNKSPSCCNNSEEIINNKREKYYKKIFKLLDSDEDNKITSEHINIYGLPKKIQKILQPIFISLEEENESLNELEFVYVCKKLYNTLSYVDKKEFTSYINDERNIFKNEKKYIYTSKSNINKRNISYEGLQMTMTGEKIRKNKKENKNNSSKIYNNLKNSAEMVNNFYLIKSGVTRNKMNLRDDSIKNYNSNKILNISKNFVKNKSSLLNSHIKNSLINSTCNINKDNKFNNYFNLRNNNYYKIIKHQK